MPCRDIDPARRRPPSASTGWFDKGGRQQAWYQGASPVRVENITVHSLKSVLEVEKMSACSQKASAKLSMASQETTQVMKTERAVVEMCWKSGPQTVKDLALGSIDAIQKFRRHGLRRHWSVP